MSRCSPRLLQLRKVQKKCGPSKPSFPWLPIPWEEGDGVYNEQISLTRSELHSGRQRGDVVATGNTCSVHEMLLIKNMHVYHQASSLWILRNHRRQACYTTTRMWSAGSVSHYSVCPWSIPPTTKQPGMKLALRQVDLAAQGHCSQ